MSIFIMVNGSTCKMYNGGWSNIELNDFGKRQIHQAGNYLKEKNIYVNRIVSSDLKRAKETSLIIGKYIDLEIQHSDRLRGLNYGLLSGISYDKMNEYYQVFLPPNIKMEKKFPGGESPNDFYKRIISTYKSLKEENNLLIVTHKLVVDVIYSNCNHIKWNINNNYYDNKQGSLHEISKGKVKELKF